MDAKAIQETLEGLGTDFEAFKKKNDERLDLVEKREPVPAELKAQIEKIESSMDERQDRLEKVEAAMKRGSIGKNSEDEAKAESAEYSDLLQVYMRKGGQDRGGLKEAQVARIQELHGKLAERKFLAVQSDPDGGYWVSPDQTGRITKRIFETSAMRNLASIQVISTDSLEGVWDGDEAGGEWTGETQAGTDETTPQVGKWSIPVHEQKTSPKATNKLLEDSQVDVEQFLGDKVSRRFARMENTAFVVGDGDGKPRGFLDYPAASTSEAFERGKIGRIVTAVNDVVGFDDLYDLQGALKDEYEVNSTWVMNRRTRTLVRKLKDSQNRYLWELSTQVGEPSLLLGRPVQSFEDMPDVADGTLPIAIGDWAEGYQIVDRAGISVLRDPFTAEPFVKFVTRKRVGGDVVQFDAIKVLEVQ